MGHGTSARAGAAMRRMSRHRPIAQIALDVGSWGVGLAAAVYLRFEFAPGLWAGEPILATVAIAALLQIGAGTAFGLYLGRWRLGSFEEVAALARVTVLVTAGLLAIARFGVEPPLVPISVALAGGVFATTLMAAGRYSMRALVDRGLRPSRLGADPVIVFGAGESGVQLVRAMLRNPDSPYYPAAILDDDPGTRPLRVMGVPVLGGREALSRAVELTGAGHLVIAVPSAPSGLIGELSNAALELDIDVSLLPGVKGLVGGISVSDLRPLSERDFLGRREISIDVDSIAQYIEGHRVLVTGAGGSIGSELCRQLRRFSPASLVMLDRDESALHAVQLSLDGRGLLQDRNLVVADIRDRSRLEEVFEEHRPEVVFHAAALKHLSLLELHPQEGWKSNVEGTANLLEMAERVGVERFVNISTDKAADPTSVLGRTKRMAERLTSTAGERTGRPYLSVRFGNVLGSRGSVLEAFRRQIDAGGPLTVTHPDVTRYFMLVEEAVQLVIQAGAIGAPGEALVLDMGAPVRIDDVARRLAARSSRPIEIVYTGLRPGEKLHEVLVGTDERCHRRKHPLISHVAVPPLHPAPIRLSDSREHGTRTTELTPAVEASRSRG